MKRIRILVVDDSTLFRRHLVDILKSDPELEVVGAAADAFEARDLLLKLSPDVITLDVEMPRMDGLTLLRKIQRYQPTPTVMVSSLTQSGTQIAIKALQEGAFAAIAKPAGKGEEAEFRSKLLTWVKTAARCDKGASKASQPVPQAASPSIALRHDRLIAIGSSTGGPQALTAVLTALPPDVPPILMAQHMPAGFTAQFAKRLNELCPFEVREAESGDEVRPGVALLAPGDHHMVLAANGASKTVELRQGPKVHHQRPAVDVLFDSVAAVAKRKAIGVILTGMGRDGADGLLAMRNAGAMTLGQDEETSVVYGMPRAAAEVGAVEQVLSIGRIPGALVQACAKRKVA